MKSLGWPALWKTLIPLAIALAGLLFAGSMDRRSLERANRLYREGALQEAATIYADRLGHDPASARLHYNLGTALIGLGNERAGEELARATARAEDPIQVRALYNLGLWNLIEALKANGSASAKAHAMSAVAANKSVLRLQPGRADAGWNLAIALRVLDSINAEDQQGRRESAKGAAARDRVRVSTHDARDVSNNENGHDGSRTAEGETAARAGEVAPLSLREASEIVGTGHRDPTMMVRKLMAFEGRALRLRASGRSDGKNHPPDRR